MPRFHGIGQLKRAWGREGLALERWPLAAELPADREALAALLEAAPRDTIELMRAAHAPGDRMPHAERPEHAAEFVDWVCSRELVLRLGNVAPFCPVAREWADRHRGLLATLFGASCAARTDVRVDLYLAAPGAVSRFHADPSHNLVHQVAGTRTVHVFSPRDERLIDAVTRPKVFLVRGEHPHYRADCESSARRFELGPHTAVYLPLLAGHWLVNGPQLSISYTISLRTPEVMREKLCHRFDARMQRLGFDHAPYGSHPLRERCKARIESWLQRVLPVREPVAHPEVTWDHDEPASGPS
jgi:hypothetical protein